MAKILILVSSPRRNGNTARLAGACLKGSQKAGHETDLVFVDDHVGHFLRDCRECRGEDGQCSIVDGFRDLFLAKYLPADGVVFATPLYWYGMSGQMKTFFDRTFCYYAASHPDSEANAKGMSNKRLGLLVSSEETYPAAALGIVHSIQEFSRYTHSRFVGWVQGHGNKRGDVEHDPGDPMKAANALGQMLMTRHFSDYRMDTERAGSVWGV
ncbi:MAG: flavodoxin family protein [Verrucomicrobiota bacterium]